MKAFPRLRTSSGRLAAIPTGLILGLSAVSAANLEWDPGFTPATPSGGTETWNAANTNWSNGTSDIAFANNDIATFGGAAGTVTFGAARTANGVIFNTSGYTLSGANDLTLNAAVNGDDTLRIADGVSNISIGLRKLIVTGGGASNIGDWINTDKVDFGSTIVAINGTRQFAISNSSASATTTITHFAVHPTTNASNASLHLNQGNVTLTNMSAGAGAAALANVNIAGNSVLRFRGTGSGALTLSGNNTLLENAGAGNLLIGFNGTSLNYDIGHDNALGARNASNALTDTVLDLAGGTLRAINGARVIENTITQTGGFTLGGSNAITLSGSLTHSGANRTLTITNTAATELSGNIYLSEGAASGRTLTVNVAGTSGVATISGAISNFNGSGVAGGLTKNGTGTLILGGSSTYTGATLVSAGTLFVNGTLGNTNVSVSTDATIGGNGSIGGNLSFADGAQLTIDLADPLMVLGLVSFVNFGFDDLVGFDVETAAVGTYILISGSNFDFTNVEHFGLANAFTRGDGAKAYFEAGSLAVTIVSVPEPGSLALTALSGFVWLRRRRR